LLSTGGLFLLVSLLLWLAAPATAQAGGFHSPYHSASAIGTAFAGASVRDDDLGFFLYNPATAARIKQAQTWSDARAFFPEGTIEPSSASTALGADITADGGSGIIAGRTLAVGSWSAGKFEFIHSTGRSRQAAPSNKRRPGGTAALLLGPCFARWLRHLSRFRRC